MVNKEHMNHKPLIVLTQGDPAGVGPELCLKAIARSEVLDVCRPVILGDVNVLKQIAHRLKLELPHKVLRPDQVGEDRAALEAAVAGAPAGVIIDCDCIKDKVEPGKPTRAAGEASYRYITLAIDGAMGGLFDGIATAPITKATLQMAGYHEPGHTEILGHRTGSKDFAMMLYSPRLAVSFATIHQSLRSVPDDLTTAKIRRVTHLTAQTIRRIRGREPRLAILGLNPHAGEDRMFGHEEHDVIVPAIEQCRADGLHVEGPIPPDAAFMPHALERFDAHVTMYHDQGSIPFKMISLHDGVNVTLGLPIVRTSPDHGTAYDVAWQGTANPSSLIAAIRLAAVLSEGN